jgi:hypothetical protein
MAISRSLGWAEDEDDAESYGGRLYLIIFTFLII